MQNFKLHTASQTAQNGGFSHLRKNNVKFLKMYKIEVNIGYYKTLLGIRGLTIQTTLRTSRRYQHDVISGLRNNIILSVTVWHKCDVTVTNY